MFCIESDLHIMNLRRKLLFEKIKETSYREYTIKKENDTGLTE